MSYSSKSKTRKFVAGFVALAFAFSLVGGGGLSTADAATLTTAQINSILNLLISFGADQSVINNVQASLTGSTPSGGGTTPPSGGTGYTFTRDLKLGDTGEDVRQLQMVLNRDSATQVAMSGVGSAGSETTYFGSLTKVAVIKFQNKYASEILAPVGLSSGTGYVGPSTRAKLNSMNVVTPPPSGGGDTGGTPPPSVGTGLSVSIPVQPGAQLAPQSAARVPFAKVTLTASNDGDIVVKSLRVARGGPSDDAVFAGIILVDQDGSQIGVAKTLNSNHQADIGDTFTVKAGTSKTLTIAGNMAADLSSYAGQVVNLSVIAVNTSASVSGSLPIQGAAHTVNASLTIGTITAERGPLDPNAAQSKDVGTTGYTFSSIKVTAGSTEDVRIHSIRWNQASSASATDLDNVMTVVDGVSYPTVVSSDFYDTVFPGGIEVKKGLSKEISVKGDIVDGSSRTVAFNIEKTTDLYVTGETYGYGITPPTSGTGFTAGNIWYPAKTVTISTGSLTVSNATAVNAQNIALNQANQPLGGFTVEVKGEEISVGSIVFTTSTTSTGIGRLTNVSIVDENGAVISGPVDGSNVDNTLTFSSSVILPVGTHTYTLKGQTPSTWSNNGTFAISTTPSSNWTTVKGQTTNQTITPSSAAVTMSTMTVKGAALAISVSPTPSAQSVVAGAQDFTFANYVLDATASGEDLRMVSLPIETAVSSGATNVTNCRIYDGGAVLTTGSNANSSLSTASSTSFTFDTALILSKGSVKTLTLKCNISTAASGVYQFGYDSTASPSATGVNSGQSATITENDSVGQRMTIVTGGSLAVALDSSSPSYAIATAGTTGNTVAIYRVSATNEDIRVTDFALQITSGTSDTGASTSPSDISKITLWDGTSKIGEALFTPGKYTASTTIGTCSGCTEFVVPKDADKLITAKVDIAEQGTSKVGTPGTLVRVDWDNASADATKGVGLGSGSTITRTDSSDTASEGVRVYRSYPTVALVDLTGSLVSGRRDLLRFKVTASPQGDVGIYKFTVRIATSSDTARKDMIDGVNAYVFTDSGFSSVATGLQTDGAMLDANMDLSCTNSCSSWGSQASTTPTYNVPWVSDSTDIPIWAMNSSGASTTVIVPAGQTRYIAVRGDVTLAGTVYSVSTQLQGDAKFVSNLAAVPFTATATSTYLASYGLGTIQGGFGAVAAPVLHYLEHGEASTTNNQATSTVDNDFIWRPFSTTTVQSAVANDYTNGYGIPGLPQANTSSQTLAQ
ncbi:MAG: peptidoglycan-binding domain-containing protein [bacterium]|nr:peptidoglycan-binding domain-containing protein [bacterium]